MRKYVVATDSGCDLPMEKCAELDIHPLQMKYVFGETTYVDSMLHSDCRTFYARMTIIFYVFVLVFFLRANATLTRASRTDEPI